MYEGWLADDNIAYALQLTCPNTHFKVVSLTAIKRICTDDHHVGPFLVTPETLTKCAACGTVFEGEKSSEPRVWRGFLIESKSYVSYETMSRKEKISFWLRFPFKWVAFQWYGLTDRLSQINITERK